MHFYDEARNNAFGHEVVFVAQNQIVGVVPGVVGRFEGEKLRGDVLSGLAGDFVTQFEVFHQVQQFVVQVLIFYVAPDLLQVFLGEIPVIVDDFCVVRDFSIVGDFFVTDDFVNSLSCQFGTQDNYIFEDGVFLEVEDNTQVVEVFAETQHRSFIGLFEALANADVEKFTDFDMGLTLGIVFQNIADVCPAFGDGRTDVFEGGDAVLQGALEGFKSAIGGEIGSEIFF